MLISRVKIVNFRILKNFSLEFDKVTTLVGRNGIGKSTVLRALDWFFNVDAAPFSPVEDSANPAAPVEVEVQFKSFSLETADWLSENGWHDIHTLTLRKIWADKSIRLQVKKNIYPKFDGIRLAKGSLEKKDAYLSLRKEFPETSLPSWTTMKNCEASLRDWELATANHFFLEERWEDLSTSFLLDSDDGLAKYFRYVFIGADLQNGDTMQSQTSAVIETLLERSLSRPTIEKKALTILQEAQKRIRTTYARGLRGDCEKAAALLNKALKVYEPNKRIVIDQRLADTKAPKVSFSLSISDGFGASSVERQGHGFQRTLLMSALHLLAETDPARGQGAICLALEEPELFQHPLQARNLAKVLRGLAEDKDKAMQVVYATHSPFFIEARYFHQIRRLAQEKDLSGQLMVVAHQAKLELVVSNLKGVVAPETVTRRLDTIITESLSPAFFASSVLLVEGETDVSIFTGIADKRTAGSLESSGIAVVATNGKDNIPLVHAILKALGLPMYVVFDGDCRDVSAQEKKQHADKNKRLLKYFGEGVQSFPRDKCGPRIATFKTDLENYLQMQWPEWATALQQVRSHAGLGQEKHQITYRLATSMATGPIPVLLKQILEKVRRVK